MIDLSIDDDNDLSVSVIMVMMNPIFCCIGMMGTIDLFFLYDRND